MDETENERTSAELTMTYKSLVLTRHLTLRLEHRPSINVMANDMFGDLDSAMEELVDLIRDHDQKLYDFLIKGIGAGT